jgi:hypothetical protein
MLINEIPKEYKYTAYGIKNYIAAKNKDNWTLIRIMKIFLRDISDLTPKICNCFIRVFYRAGMLFLEQKKYFLSATCFLNAVSVIEKNLNDSTKESLDTIHKRLEEIHKEIKVQVKFY